MLNNVNINETINPTLLSVNDLSKILHSHPSKIIRGLELGLFPFAINIPKIHPDEKNCPIIPLKRLLVWLEGEDLKNQGGIL